ncbi:hypothetical protein EPI10_031044 [Gossypium australe]|uniref:Uncharacterized protein n=1 Tax=Gossypium australe TaxID=47621 RepID=A0A5B6X2J6_9ROSI|nr:hypothetical protein EPI10_031044 [Gossypium australe]
MEDCPIKNGDGKKRLSIRGLGNLQAIRRLQHMLKKFCPQIVFFMEMKLNYYRMERCYCRCGFQNGR